MKIWKVILQNQKGWTRYKILMQMQDIKRYTEHFNLPNTN